MTDVKKKGETKKKRGRPATGKDPTFTLRMPVEQRAAAERVAEEEGLTLSKAILRIFEEGLAARKKKGKGQ
jgi:hypothetical protein